MVTVKEKTTVTQRIRGNCPTHSRTEISVRDVKAVIDDAALYIQLPTFATTVAIHSTVNAACRNGLQAELGTSATVLPEVPVTRCCRVGRSTIRMRLERPNKRCYVRLLLQSHRLRRNRPPLRRTKAVG